MIFSFTEKLVLKYHQQQGWSNLDVKIMFNWPHISVKFSTSEIEIRRSNKHQYVRYISLPASIRHTMKSDFIEEVDYIDEKRQRKVYTVNLLKEYCRKYLESYKRHVIEVEHRKTLINHIVNIIIYRHKIQHLVKICQIVKSF